MTINQLLKEKFPIENAIEDLKRLSDDPSELGDMEQAYDELKKTEKNKFAKYDRFFFPEFADEIDRTGKVKKSSILKRYLKN